MSTLRERLADPHGYAKPLFPRAIEEMSHEEKQAELLECAKALRINVWQTTAQMEETQQRHIALFNDMHERLMSELKAQQSKEASK